MESQKTQKRTYCFRSVGTNKVEKTCCFVALFEKIFLPSCFCAKVAEWINEKSKNHTVPEVQLAAVAALGCNTRIVRSICLAHRADKQKL